MAEKVSDWLLRKIEREDWLVEETGGKPWRGEILYKGDVIWIIDGKDEEELEWKAWRIMPLARPMASDDDGDPGSKEITFLALE